MAQPWKNASGARACCSSYFHLLLTLFAFSAKQFIADFRTGYGWNYVKSISYSKNLLI